MKANNQLRKILVSQTRIKLIDILFYQPREIFYVRELVRLTDEEINSVRRELANLLEADLIFQDKRANRIYYGANSQSFYFYDLLLLAHKNSGLGSNFFAWKTKIGRLNYVLMSFDFAMGSTYSPDIIDLVIVGDVSYKEVEKLIKEEEDQRNREINYMIMDKNEFRLRRNRRDQFIIDFFLRSPLVIFGNLNYLDS